MPEVLYLDIVHLFVVHSNAKRCSVSKSQVSGLLTQQQMEKKQTKKQASFSCEMETKKRDHLGRDDLESASKAKRFSLLMTRTS